MAGAEARTRTIVYAGHSDKGVLSSVRSDIEDLKRGLPVLLLGVEEIRYFCLDGESVSVLVTSSVVSRGARATRTLR